MQKLILEKDAPFEAARRFLPLYVFLVGFIIALVTLLKGLKHVGLDLSPAEATLYAVLTGLVVTIIGTYFLGVFPTKPKTEVASNSMASSGFAASHDLHGLRDGICAWVQ